MADKWPLANGNWSNAANWNGGTKPVAGDTVYADGKTVTVDENVNLTSAGIITNGQRSGGINSGLFNLHNGITVTATFVLGANTYTLFQTTNIGSGTVTLNGNITHSFASGFLIFGTTGSPSHNYIINGNFNCGGQGYCNAITYTNFAGGSTLTINGNITGYAGNNSICIVNGQSISGTVLNINGDISNNSGRAVSITSGPISPVVNVVGSIIGGSGSYSALEIGNTSATINMTGNITGGSASSAHAIGTNANTVSITGTVTGGSGSGAAGLWYTGTGTAIINGNCIGGTAGVGARNDTTGGRLYVYGTAIGNTYGLGGASSAQPGVSGGGTNIGVVDNYTTIRAMQFGPNGSSPVSGRVHLDTANLANSFVKLRTSPTSFTEYTFGPPENIGGQPAASNVRLGTVYNFGNTTGTCAVPPAASVAYGVPVDNTTGTAVLTEAGLSALLQAALQPNAPMIVERSTNDNKAITFSWPVSGATITGQKSIDNGAYSAVAGAITFLRTESNRHYYALAYNAADRNTVESSIRYKMTDGTYTKYFNLHVVPSGDVNVTVSPLTAEQEPRNTRSRIIVYTGEGGTQYFYAIDSAGNSLNLTGFNLELRFAKGKSVIYTAKTSNGSLTVSNNNQVTFTRSAALTRGDGELTYALRNMGAGEEVLLDGPVTVRYAP